MRNSMVNLRHMTGEELARVEEIDVSERGATVYAVAEGKLVLKEEPWQRQRRSAEKWQPHIEQWQTLLEQGGAAIGAFEDGRLVGVTVLRYRLTHCTAQLAALFVDRAHRRAGIASALTRELIRLAQAAGARDLYVSATPSESAVGFYTSQGFHLAQQVNEALYELEPEDIHLLRSL